MSESSGIRALVTGGAGFIGSHLVDALLEGGASRVVVVDNFFLGRDSNLDQARTSNDEALVVYREDAADPVAMGEICRRERPEVTFNLATKALGYSFFNPPGACRVNLEIALTLAELLRHGAFERLVHVSSSEVYGSGVHVPMDENHPLLAETTYAAGKAAADLALASYVRMFGLDITIVRPFNNYGPRQNDGSFAAVVPLTIRHIMAGERPVIYGDGTQTRDFIYVGDTARVLLEIADLGDAPSGAVLNIGTGRETSILELVETISELMGYEGPVDYREARPADVRRHCADVGRVSALLNGMKATPLADGLERTIKWYREQP